MLIDTNVLVDVALDRRPHSIAAIELVNRLVNEPGRAFVAWHAIATFHYVVSKELSDTRARELVVFITGFAEVVPTGTESIRYALSLPMADFEDAMQVAAARAAGVQHIITRDARDFANSPIPAITPEQALQELF